MLGFKICRDFRFWGLGLQGLAKKGFNAYGFGRSGSVQGLGGKGQSPPPEKLPSRTVSIHPNIIWYYVVRAEIRIEKLLSPLLICAPGVNSTSQTSKS